MKDSRVSGRTDNNWFDSAEGVLFFYRQRLAQFQLRMDHGTVFLLMFSAQKYGDAKYYSFRHPRKVVAIIYSVITCAMFHTIAFTLNNDHFAVMQETVKYGRGDSGIVMKNFGPFLERFIAGNNY